MRESDTYQYLQEKFTIENIIALLEAQFHPEAVKAITPALEKVADLQKLKQLHLAAAKAEDIEAFARLIDE